MAMIRFVARNAPNKSIVARIGINAENRMIPNAEINNKAAIVLCVYAILKVP